MIFISSFQPFLLIRAAGNQIFLIVKCTHPAVYDFSSSLQAQFLETLRIHFRLTLRKCLHYSLCPDSPPQWLMLLCFVISRGCFSLGEDVVVTQPPVRCVEKCLSWVHLPLSALAGWVSEKRALFSYSLLTLASGLGWEFVHGTLMCTL